MYRPSAFDFELSVFASGSAIVEWSINEMASVMVLGSQIDTEPLYAYTHISHQMNVNTFDLVKWMRVLRKPILESRIIA